MSRRKALGVVIFSVAATGGLLRGVAVKLQAVLQNCVALADYGHAKPRFQLSKKVEKWQNGRALFSTAVSGAFRPGVMAAQRFLVPLVWVRILGAERFAF